MSHEMQTVGRTADTADAAQEFLTFRLGEEEYGIEILAFIKGVINLRGVIVPIVDLRIKFGLGQAEYNQFTVVIVLNVGGRVVGSVVDSVSDVLTLQPEQMRPAPPFSSSLDTKYLTGFGAVDDRMLILLDIERLMLSSEMALTDNPVD